MKNKKTNTITIIGSGLAGCFLAVLLAQKGFKVDIYERLSKMTSATQHQNAHIILSFLVTE